MRNLSNLVRWDIWLAKVEFEENNDFKIRPVLIINNNQCYVLSLKITSHTPRVGQDGGYQIICWEKAGLAKPSTVRISKRITLPAESFIKRIGRLEQIDCDNILKIYQGMYQLDYNGPDQSL